jgi:hypothetical protein
VLKRDGTTDAYRNRMFDFQAINDIVGTTVMLARGQRYEESRGAPLGDASRKGAR